MVKIGGQYFMYHVTAETQKVALILAELYKNLMLFRGGQCGQKLTLNHMDLTYSLRCQTF